jgi:DnaJ-class molecular chaperone
MIGFGMAASGLKVLTGIIEYNRKVMEKCQCPRCNGAGIVLAWRNNPYVGKHCPGCRGDGFKLVLKGH